MYINVKKISFFITTCFVILILSFVLVEVVLRVSTKETKLEPYYNTFKNSAFNRVNSSFCSWSKSLYPHPYTGFVQSNRTMCKDRKTNLRGMFGEEYPYKRDEKYFDILVLGGSVASNLTKPKPKTSNDSRFIKALKEGHRGPNGEKIRVFSGSVGAWKQPAQLYHYLLYQDLFDGLILIEGANEVSTGANYKLAVPLDFVANFLRARDLNLNFEYFILDVIQSFRIWSQTFLGVRLEVIWQNHINDMHQALVNTYELKNFFKVDPRSQKDKLEGFVDEYVNYLEVFKLVAQRNNQKIKIIFQPTIHYMRKEHPEESHIPKGEIVYTQLYPKVVEKILKRDTLFKNDIYNALEIFKHSDYRVYEDYVHFYEGKNGESKARMVFGSKIIELLQRDWKLKSILD
jgi:hypothetical protein